MDITLFKWSIDNFLGRTEKKIASPSFSIPCLPHIEWCLELYPNGDRSEATGFVSLFLRKVTDGFDAEIEFDLAIVGADGQEKRRPGKTFFDDNSSWGWDRFVSRNQLTSKLLVDGKLMMELKNVRVIRVVELNGSLNATVFSWNIDDFMSQKEKELKSEKFIIPGHPSIEWYLKCYPDGNRQEDNGFVSIFLYNCTNNCEIEIEYQLVIVTDRQQIKYTHKSVFKLNNLGWFKFISRDQLVNEGYLIDGTLKIQAKVLRVLRVAYLDDRLNREPFDLASVKYSDFRLKTNGKTFEVNKFVLAKESSYFEKLFDSDFKERKTNEVYLSLFQPHVIKEVLRFIYSGQLQNFDSLSGQLIFAADYLQMDKLKFLCQENLKFRISVENCLRFLVIADQVNATQLKEVAMRFIDKNRKRISLDSWKELLDHQKLAIEWMSQRKF